MTPTRRASRPRLGGYRLSPDVAALNSALLADATLPRAAQEDMADTLLAHARQLRTTEHAAVAAVVLGLVRDHPFGRYRIDLADVARKLAIEIDGGQWCAGGGKHSSQADYAKTNALTAAGWQVYRLRATDVRRDPLVALTTIAAWVQAGVREEPS